MIINVVVSKEVKKETEYRSKCEEVNPERLDLIEATWGRWFLAETAPLARGKRNLITGKASI